MTYAIHLPTEAAFDSLEYLPDDQAMRLMRGDSDLMRRDLSGTDLLMAIREQGFDVHPVGPEAVELDSALNGPEVFPSLEALALHLFGTDWAVELG